MYPLPNNNKNIGRGYTFFNLLYNIRGYIFFIVRKYLISGAFGWIY